MWYIIQNEWKYLIRNRLLLAISLVFLLILGTSIFLGNLQIKKQNEQYITAKKEIRQQWESIEAMNPHSAAHYGTYVFKPSNMLSSLDEGVQSITGNVLRVEGHVQNEMVHSEASQMQSVSKFGKLKSALLLQYILPLVLVFLAFHSLTSEKQSRRLQLLVLQGTKLSSIIWAKIFSIWLYGLGLLTLTIVTYTIFNLQSINSDVVVRVILFYFSYAMYYFIISGLTILFSARWQNSTVALTSMIGIWILWTIFIPNIFMTSMEKWHKLPSRNDFQAAMKSDRSNGVDGHNPADQRAKALQDSVLQVYGVDSLSQLSVNFDGIVMQADEEYGNQVWDKHFGNLRKVLVKQKRSYQMAGIINPFISLQNASMGYAGSDNLHHQEFLLQVETYRREFIKTLNDKQAYGGSKTGDWGWKAENDFFKSVPDYEYRPTTISSMFPNYLFDLLLLVFWSLFVSILLIGATKKIQII